MIGDSRSEYARNEEVRREETKRLFDYYVARENSGRTIILGEGMKVSNAPVPRPAPPIPSSEPVKERCKLCQKVIWSAKAGCLNQNCLGWNDTKWALHEANEWWESLTLFAPEGEHADVDEVEPLPVGEYEDRVWQALTDPPAHVRNPGPDKPQNYGELLGKHC